MDDEETGLPAIALLRRYLKLVILYCTEHNLMGVPLELAGKIVPPLRSP